MVDFHGGEFVEVCSECGEGGRARRELERRASSEYGRQAAAAGGKKNGRNKKIGNSIQ